MHAARAHGQISASPVPCQKLSDRYLAAESQKIVTTTPSFSFRRDFACAATHVGAGRNADQQAFFARQPQHHRVRVFGGDFDAARPRALGS